MSLSNFVRTALYIGIVSLQGCGGGGSGGDTLAGVSDTPGDGGSSGGGIGGTGVTTSGTINGFGSIFVNGIEFETDEAEILLDGQSVGEDALGLGMVVLVKGTVNDDGVTGTATTVVFDDEVQGPISDIQPGGDGNTKILVVLGVTIIVERVGTVFEDVSFDELAIDDLVEVSGFFDDSRRLRATRIDKKSGFVDGVSEVELKGIVEGLAGTEFIFGVYTVDYSSADLSDVPGGRLQDGMAVEVKGTLQGSLIAAAEIELEGGITESFDGDEDVSIEGTITNFVDSGEFEIAGVMVDASSAILIPSSLVMAAGIVVEAEGHWNGEVLIAETIESRRGRIEIEAMVASVSENSVTLQLFGGTVTVKVDTKTLLDDDTDAVGSLRISDIRAGDFLEVEAVQSGGSLVATRIDRDETDDDVLQAPVESFVANNSVTLLGITYDTSGAEFENADDVSVTEAEFYSVLEVGMLIKVEDEEVADGIADEVEFESDIKFGSNEDETDSEDESDSEDEPDSEDSEDPQDPEDPESPEDPQEPQEPQEPNAP